LWRFGWEGGFGGVGKAGEDVFAGAAGVELVRGQTAEDGDAGGGGGDGVIHGLGSLISWVGVIFWRKNTQGRSWRFACCGPG
jgi:hypothetical protein